MFFANELKVPFEGAEDVINAYPSWSMAIMQGKDHKPSNLQHGDGLEKSSQIHVNFIADFLDKKLSMCGSILTESINSDGKLGFEHKLLSLSTVYMTFQFVGNWL